MAGSTCSNQCAVKRCDINSTATRSEALVQDVRDKAKRTTVYCPGCKVAAVAAVALLLLLLWSGTE
jgi:hypothetical protein